MEEIEIITQSWKKIRLTNTVKDSALLNIKNSTIMESVVKFEKDEKDEKTKQKVLGSWSIIVLTAAIAWSVYGNDFQLTPYHYIGFILFVGSLAFSIIANRTDDFPDARLLPTVKYLDAVKNHVMDRRKRHHFNFILGTIVMVPGICLMMDGHSYFAGYWWALYALAASIIGYFYQKKKYKDRTSPLINEIEDMISQID